VPPRGDEPVSGGESYDERLPFPYIDPMFADASRKSHIQVFPEISQLGDHEASFVAPCGEVGNRNGAVREPRGAVSGRATRQ
jgi:hypothetical protein